MTNPLALLLAFSLLKKATWFSFGEFALSPFNAVLMGPSVEVSSSQLVKESSRDPNYDHPNPSPRDLNS